MKKPIICKSGISGVLMAIFFVATICGSWAKDSEKIHLGASFVYAASPELRPEALELVFTNRSTRAIVIPFCSKFGKASHETYSSRDKSGAVFAKLKFNFLNHDSQIVQSGEYTISSLPLRLEPKQSETFLIPITAPTQSPFRKLEIEFDNQFVEKAIHSFNIFRFVPPGSDLYFSKKQIIQCE